MGQHALSWLALHSKTHTSPHPLQPRPAPPRPAGMRLRYFEWNAGGEDTVLLLHDLAEAAEAWAPVAEGLRQRGYRVLAPDLRGGWLGALAGAAGWRRQRTSRRLQQARPLA